MVAGEIMIVWDTVYEIWASWQSGDITIDMLDLLFVVTAVVFNLQVVGVYIASKNGRLDISKKFGAMILILAIPLAIVFSGYWINGREMWIMLGLGVIFLYLFLELLLDFILKIQFRKKPLMHIPYIILFYVVQVALITIAFSIDRSWGWFVSVTFWALLVALIYSLWPKKKPSTVM